MSKKIWRLSTLIVLVLFLIAIILKIHSKQQAVLTFDDAVITSLNIILLGLVPIVISVITAEIYIRKNIYSALTVCCGMLALGIGSILLEVLEYGNTTVTVYTTCIFICAVFHITTALWERMAFPRPFIRFKISKLFASIIGILSIIFLIFLGSSKGKIPSFTNEDGYSVIRDIILELTIILYFSTFVIFRKHYRYLKIKLLDWYSIWLLILAIGIFSKLINHNNTFLYWLSSICFYVGSFFGIILIKEVILQDKKDITLSSKIMKYFANVITGSRFIESSDNAIIMVDDQLNILFYNTPSKKIFKYDEQEIKRKSLTEILVGPYINLIVSDFENYKKTGISKLLGCTHQMEARDKYGRVFPIEISVFVNKFEKQYSSTYIIRDITCLKKFEKETKRQNKILNTIKHIHDSSIKCSNVRELYHECITIIEKVTNSEFCFVNQKGQDVITHHTAFNDLGWIKLDWNEEMPCSDYLGNILENILMNHKSLYTNTPPNIDSAPKGHPKDPQSYVFPVKQGDNNIGVIGVARRNGAYSYETKEILKAIAPTVMQVLSHKEVEEKLYDSEQRFHAFMDASPCVALMKNEQGQFIYFNKTWEDMYGEKAKDNIGKTNYDMFPVEVADRIKPIEQEILKTGKVLDTNEELYRPGTKKLTWRMLRFPFVSLSGKKFTGCIALDITTQKKNENELRKNESLLRSIIEGTNDPIYLKDCDGRCLMANTAASKMMGLSIDKLLGKTDKEVLINSDNAKALIELDKYIMDCKLPQTIEQTIVGLQETRVFLTTKSPWYDIDGNVSGIVNVSHDITDRKRIEFELQERAEELEQKNQLITDFFINISHEFKTPISILKLAIELANMDYDNGNSNMVDTGKTLNVMNQNINRLSKLVSNLLDITKIDAGFMQPNWSRVDVVDLLSNLVDSVKLFASKRSLDINFISNLSSKVIITDSEFIERIVLNIISNSIKHTQSGGNIDVEFREVRDSIIIAVRDNGEGIPDSKKSMIFDRFRQANNSLARSSEGCGIGLSLTKALVELLGGSIAFKSEEGKGCDFYVRLPVKNANHIMQNNFEQSENLKNIINMEFSDIIFD